MAELALRSAMHHVGAQVLEKVLSLDNGYRGPRVDCGAGHQARFVSYRTKVFDTVLGPIAVTRAYYHCADCGHGRAPLDDELGITGTSMSPGAAAMVARVGAAGPFAKGSDLLAELAGLTVDAKRVERHAEADGETLARIIAADAAADGDANSNGPAPEKLYVALDGTGVPTVAAETEGRAGKGADGHAHTRETKLAVVFTQTKLDDDGRPVRDPESSTYLATLEPAESFGRLMAAEARRRGAERAATVVVLGDGAPWIWNLASRHYPQAIQIVDLFHAREHLHALHLDIAVALVDKGKTWIDGRLAELDDGNITDLVSAFAALDLTDTQRADVDKKLAYFETNAHRMRYRRFRELGLFVGSGVVEAGCRSVIAQRLKQSGMRWTTRGATGIATLRCEHASHRWDQSRLRIQSDKRAA
ncbi:MAG: ISKra4 family transposase [Actinomycetota bacterium]|nr:ISKra4 family transposase [Actinomycetota bacterium]